jgi:hypothetical protein
MLRVSWDRLAALAGAESVPADADHQTLVDGFAALLDAAAARQRVVVLLDGLDRLEPSPEAQGMAWLPKHWPANARLVATAIEGAEATACAVRLGIAPTPLPPLSAADARDVVRHLSALERRHPAVPLWLSLAFGQLSRLPGRYYRLTPHRLEARADDRLTGLLRDWVARLPGEPMALFAAMLNEAEAHFGAAARILATVLALTRRGWRESDIAALLAARTRCAWLPLDVARHMISPFDADYLFSTFRASVHNVLCRRCDIPRLPGRRLTGCAITEMERTDADREAARFQRAHSAGMP